MVSCILLNITLVMHANMGSFVKHKRNWAWIICHFGIGLNLRNLLL